MTIEIHKKTNSEICWKIMLTDKHSGYIIYYPANKRFKIASKGFAIQFHNVKDNLIKMCEEWMLEDILLGGDNDNT